MLPSNPSERKDVPLFSGLVRYFPDALAYVARVSLAGNKQHHPDEPLHWDRAKSTDEHDALLRHLFEAGTTDIDGLLHSGKVAWRALAALQKEIESDERINKAVADTLPQLLPGTFVPTQSPGCGCHYSLIRGQVYCGLHERRDHGK